MTSEQIRTLCLQVATMGAKADDGGHVALSLMQTQAIWEVALQLAIANEGGSRIDWQEQCLCGHRRVEHGAVGCSIFVDDILCGCSGFKPA